MIISYKTQAGITAEIRARDRARTITGTTGRDPGDHGESEDPGGPGDHGDPEGPGDHGDPIQNTGQTFGQILQKIATCCNIVQNIFIWQFAQILVPKPYARRPCAFRSPGYVRVPCARKIFAQG